jgi:hypothetical protein
VKITDTSARGDNDRSERKPLTPDGDPSLVDPRSLMREAKDDVSYLFFLRLATHLIKL